MKILFFDLDQTLWDHHYVIPMSTINAIKKARKNGHLAFINTGRTRCYISFPFLFEIGFDGAISGCGTMIEHKARDADRLMLQITQNTIIDKYTISKLTAIQVLSVLRAYDFHSILEGIDVLYLNVEDFPNDAYITDLVQKMKQLIRPIKADGDVPCFSKFSCDLRWSHDAEAGIRSLSRWFNCLSHSINVAEFVPHGYTKGRGIQAVCKALGVNVADTIAFGDSVNDLDMMQTAGIGIAMGNAASIVREKADFVTKPMGENGIEYALKAFGII